jgi:hypothetical protein
MQLAYADSDFYKATFCGDIIPDEQLPKYLQRASDDIDVMTYNRIVWSGFDKLTPLQQMQVKKAVCYQADHRYQYGDMADLGVSNYHVGDTSVQMGSKDLRFSPQAHDALIPTNLLYRGFAGNENAVF